GAGVTTGTPAPRAPRHVEVRAATGATGGRNGIDELLAAARAGLDRVPPEKLDAERASGALVVDIRPAEQRHRDGELPGAIVIDRNVLEWRLDPTSPHHVPEVTHDR